MTLIIPNYSSVSNLGLGKKNSDPKNRTEPGPKSSIEPESKLIKYPNGFKILVFKESKPNQIRTEIFWVPGCIPNRFINIYINYFLI